MGKPDGLSRYLGEAKYVMDAYFFNKGQLLNLDNEDVEEEEYTEDIEWQEINVAT